MPTDHEALQGFWKLTAGTVNGEDCQHPDLGTVFRFTGNRFVHRRSKVSYRFELHPDLQPKGLDFVLISTKSVARGLYELNGDTLRMLHSSLNKPRPASFDDPNLRLEVYTRFHPRVKPQKAPPQGLKEASLIKERIPCPKCGAMILPVTALATGGVCMPCKKNPHGRTFGPGIGKLGPLGKFLSGKMPHPSGERTQWLELCTLEVTSGKLWMGDPLLADEEDGCVATVPVGTYVVEGIGCFADNARTVYSLRARLQSAATIQLGAEIGETGTDCGLMGICDIGAMDAVSEETAANLEDRALRAGFGRIALKKLAVMAFVPSGEGDGCGPVTELLESGARVGFQQDFYPSEDNLGKMNC